MKLVTQQKRVGEHLGDIDWSYDFRSHFDLLCCNDAGRDESCETSKQQLAKLEFAFKAGKRLQATTSGGWPRLGWHPVINIGMYDGWPYWKPVPSVCLQGPLGPEWHAFNAITGVTDTDADKEKTNA